MRAPRRDAIPGAMVEGACDARFAAVRETFAAAFDTGREVGASLAVNIDGEMVVDLWGGWADEARTVPWTETRSPTCSPPPRR